MNLADNMDLRRLYAVRLFIVRCILPDSYHFPEQLEQSIHLTAAGQSIFEQLRENNESLSPADAKAAVFAEFASDGKLLVDYEQTKYIDMATALTPDIRKTVIRYPWVYGDVLEAAYIEAYGREPKEFLSHDETISVMTRLPPGVFQVADVTVGPFGMLKVLQQRCIPPSLCGPEISCIDPGCDGIHHIIFTTGTTDAGTAYNSIDSPPMATDIRKLIEDLVRPDDQYYRPDNDWGLPWLLMSGITPQESRSLLAKLLSANIDSIREFANTHLEDPLPKASPSEISHRITEAEMCQMFMTVTNESLVRSIEEMINAGDIEVGRTETRMPIRSRHIEGGAFRTVPQISRLGVRFIPKEAVAPLMLRAFILELYKGEAEKELAWLLRDQPGETNVARLDNLLFTADAGQIINRLVMISRERVLDAFRLLQYGKFDLPSNPESDRELTEKILWKLGDDLAAPPCPENGVLNRINVFRRVSAQEKNRSEESIDSIRGVGISMFVALEALLADVVDYVCWMLLSDHYSENRRMRFVYRKDVARSFTRPLLASRSREGSFEFDVNGNNSLGTLIEALRVIADLSEESIASPSEFARSEGAVPFMAAYSNIFNFPFIHTRLILDIEPGSASATLGALRGAATELYRTDAPKLRNSLGHPRSSFPGDDDVAKGCLGIETALAVVRAQGLLPTVYMRASRTSDAFGRVLTTMNNGNGRSISLSGPSELAPAGLPPLDRPQLIASGVHLAGSIQPLRLAYVEETRFTDLLDAHAPLRASGSTIDSDVVTSDSDESAY